MVRLGRRRWCRFWQLIGRNDGELADFLMLSKSWCGLNGEDSAGQLNNSPDPLMVSWTMDCFFPVFLYLPVTCSDVVIVIQWPLRLDQSQGVKKSKIFFLIIIIVLTVHLLAVVNETRTPFVHFDFLGEHFGVTWKCEEVYMSCAAWTQILNLPSYSDSPFLKLTSEIFTFSMKSGQTLNLKKLRASPLRR